MSLLRRNAASQDEHNRQGTLLRREGGFAGQEGAFALSRLSPRAVPAKRPPSRPQVPRETFGMLRLRGFRLTVYCDPCKEAHFINLVERPDLADVPVGGVDFQC